VATWFQIALVMNLICWAVFFYLLFRRSWNWAALAVGIFHMFFAMLVSVAPFRAVLDPNYMNYQLGFVQFKGRAAAFPAALVLSWALAAAWVAVAKARGRWMTIIAVGDILFALSVGGAIVVGGPQEWKFQLGESLTITGVAGLLVLLFLFTVPFVISGVWAVRRAGSGGTAGPLPEEVRDEHAASGEHPKDVDGFRYGQSRV
jgi:hypothetical protein